MTNAYKTAVNEYMIQRGFEDADGNVLKPFHDRVIRPGDPDFGQGTEDQVMRNADAAFAGVADEGYDRGSDTAVADSVTGSVAAERDRVTVADAVDSTASGTPAGTAVEPDGMSSHARSTRRKSNTAVEQIETDWKHAAVRPAPRRTARMAARGNRQGGPPRLLHRLLLPGAQGHTEHRPLRLLPLMAGSGRSAELERGRRRTCHADEP